MSLKAKMFGLSAVLIITVLVTSSLIIRSVNQTKDDADIVNALGRQRMLSQAMAKAALAYSQKGELTGIMTSVQLLDDYITQMRAAYTSNVAQKAATAGIELSMDPSAEAHPAFPFPATFTRIVNEKFVKGNELLGRNMKLDILSDNPVNPDKGLVTDMDIKANSFLKQSGMKIYQATEIRQGALYLLFYTPDVASVEACASCHVDIKGGNLSVGDMLGVRKFELLFARDAAAGMAKLNPTLTEYEAASKIFNQTLQAMKRGGEYPANLDMSEFHHINGIDNPAAQEKINEIETQLNVFISMAKRLTTERDEKKIQKDQVGIGQEANKLRKLSNDLVDIYTEIANKGQETIWYTSVAAGIMIFVFSVVIFLFVWIGVLKPIEDASLALKDIAEGDGDLTKRLKEKSNDEIGQLAHWFNKFADNLSSIIGQIAQSSRVLSTSSGDMSEVSVKLATGAEQMNAQSNAVASSTEQMSANISSVAAAVEQMSVNVSSVSTGAEEMSSSMKGVNSSMDGVAGSIQRINDNAREASEVVNQVLERSQMAESAMKTLGDAASEIGKVTDVIKRIAEQTNLLALNATIEAASAGAAGKGFAVVANEIKQLAAQSAGAAEDISQRIEGVQNNTNHAVDVIGEVLSTLNLINQSVAQITDSVESQNQASGQISGAVSRAAAGADSIASSISEVAKGANDVSSSSGEAAKAANETAENIHGISAAAKETSLSAHKVSLSSKEIGKIARELSDLVNRFKI